jgi:hypothetical protein
MWQDYVFLTGQWIFIIALLPSIFSVHKPELLTSVMTGLVLLVYAVTFYSMGLVYGAISTAITAVCWLILAYQRGTW